jgi:hypothetical protein
VKAPKQIERVDHRAFADAEPATADDEAGPMIASSEMSFPSLRSAHVFSDEFAAATQKRQPRIRSAVVTVGLGAHRGIPLVGRDEWPLSWWWPPDTCLRECRPPRRC